MSSRIVVGEERSVYITLQSQRRIYLTRVNDQPVVPCLPKITDHIKEAFVVILRGTAGFARGVGESCSDIRPASEQIVQHTQEMEVTPFVIWFGIV